MNMCIAGNDCHLASIGEQLRVGESALPEIVLESAPGGVILLAMDEVQMSLQVSCVRSQVNGECLCVPGGLGGITAVDDDART